MLREGTNIKEFKNGNISIRFNPDDMPGLSEKRFSAIELLSWTLENLDCYFVGDEFCLNNFAMGAMIYNCHSDLVYIIDLNDIEKVLSRGDWLRLYARKPDENDREIINEWGA